MMSITLGANDHNTWRIYKQTLTYTMLMKAYTNGFSYEKKKHFPSKNIFLLKNIFTIVKCPFYFMKKWMTFKKTFIFLKLMRHFLHRELETYEITRAFVLSLTCQKSCSFTHNNSHLPFTITPADSAMNYCRIQQTLSLLTYASMWH